MEAGSSPCRFPGPAAAARKDSGGLLDHGRNNICGLGSQRGILTDNVPCAFNSPLGGDHSPAVGLAPGTPWDLTLTLTLPRPGTLHHKPKPASNPNPAFEPPSGMGRRFSPRGRSRDHSLFGPGGVPGLNSNPSECSVSMEIHFQRLKTPRAWDPEAVQAHAAWKVEAHHVVSRAWLQLPDRIPEAPPSGANRRVWPWRPKRDPDQHRPLCPQFSPSQKPRPCCGFDARNFLGPNPNPNPTPNWDPPPKPKPASIPNPAFDRLLAWALTSALEGDHETAVASALAVSLDRTLTLTNAHPHGEPIPTSENTTRLGSRSGAGSCGMERGSSPCHFPGLAAAAREDSRVSSIRGRSTCVALAAKEGS